MANRAAHLFARAASDGDRVALLFGDERYTFADLAARVRTAAGGLAHLGIGQGSRVGILLPSTPAFIIVQQALFALGAIVTPLNILYRAREVAYAVESCDLGYLITSPEFADRACDHSSPTLRSVIAAQTDGSDHVSPMLSLPDAIAASEPLTRLAPVADEDVVMLLLTSATTGKAKGVMLTAANLAANYDPTPSWLGLNDRDVILCALPLYNTFGLNQGINAMLVAGATMVLLPRFDAEGCIDATTRHGCTFLPAVPTMLQKIVDHPRANTQTLGSLKRIMTGGAPVPAALLGRVVALTGSGTTVLTGYGLTEATALVTLAEVRLGPDGDLEHGRTIGRVLDGMTLAIAGEDGRLLPPGDVGEIVVQGPNLMQGYHRAPEDSALALTGGWLRTGDLGYIDADGFAFIVDRKKDVIIRGGQNIYPADIEEVIYAVPGVAEVAVIGVADVVLGEVPVAFVALRPGSDVSSAVIAARCEAELARYKLPAAIHFRDELPKGPTGKILRRELRHPLAPQV